MQSQAALPTEAELDMTSPHAHTLHLHDHPSRKQCISFAIWGVYRVCVTRTDSHLDISIVPRYVCPRRTHSSAGQARGMFIVVLDEMGRTLLLCEVGGGGLVRAPGANQSILREEHRDVVPNQGNRSS